METIKQDDRVSCVACVAAMATGTTVEEFRKFIGDKDPPYSDSDCYKFMLTHGYAVGIGFENEDHATIWPFDKLVIEFEAKKFPAYLVVESMRFKGADHAIYWDGEKVHDPNPDLKENGLPLQFYRIKSWFPIVKLVKKERP